MQHEPQDSAPANLSEGLGNFRLLQIAWRRKSLFLLGLVVALVLAGLYYVQAPRIYQSVAQVLVVKKRPDAVTGMDTRQHAIEDYVSTHQVLIKSPLIVDRAIKKHHLEALSSFQGEKDDLTELIIKKLVVTRNKSTGSSNNNVLDLACQVKVDRDATEILDGVIDSYKEFLDETYRNMSDDTLELVTRARDLLQKELAQKELAYREFRQNAPLLTRGQDGNHLRQDRLTGIESKRSTLLLRQTDLQSHLTALEDAKRHGVDRQTLLATMADFTARADTDISRRTAPPTFQEQLLPLLSEEQKLLERFGPNHTQVRSVRERIQAARDLYADASAAWRKSDVQLAGAVVAATDPVEAHVSYLRQQLIQLKTSTRLIEELYQQEQDEVRKLTRYEIQDEAHRTDIARVQQLFDGIVKQLQNVGLAKAVGGFDARTIAPPTLGKKVAPSGLVVFPTALLLGGLLGLGLVYLADATDHSFRTVQEIRSRLGLPVVGCIPQFEPGEETGQQLAAEDVVMDPMLCTYHLAKSPGAEAYRGVRTALYFSTLGVGHKLIQITSPSPGDGKSTLAANLAVSIAQSGKKILLIDADLRKPQAHRLFGLSSAVGLGSIIAGEADHVDAVQRSCVPGLSVLPCGPLPPNPAELLTSTRFQELLERLRAQYDFVIVDTPPLLAVTDPSVVAPRVDGVVLTIRLGKNNRPAAERAREILSTLGANVLGVVVNGADARSEASYGYGYGYGYESDEQAEDKEEDTAALGGDAAVTFDATVARLSSEETLS